MTATAPTADRLAELERLATRAGDELDGASAIEILRWADEVLGDSWCVASSMADAVLPHLASVVHPGVDVVFLDTGYHFAETLGMADAVGAVLPVTVKTVRPVQTVAEQDATEGKDLFARDPNRCCALRKVEPLNRALSGYSGWASGLRRDEATTRAGVKVVEWDAKRALVKLNPIAAWTQDDVDAYITEHHILVNPLFDDGYGSIGCAPCTQRIPAGADARSGRWAGTGKIECGIHT